MPFLLEQSRWLASIHLWSGILLSSKTVSTVTLNCFRQSPQNSKPGRAPFPFSLLCDAIRQTRPLAPQWGQTGPLGQRIDSRCLRAASSSWNRASSKIASVMACFPLSEWVKHTVYRAFAFVKVIIANWLALWQCEYEKIRGTLFRLYDYSTL